MGKKDGDWLVWEIQKLSKSVSGYEATYVECSKKYFPWCLALFIYLLILLLLLSDSIHYQAMCLTFFGLIYYKMVPVIESKQNMHSMTAAKYFYIPKAFLKCLVRAHIRMFQGSPTSSFENFFFYEFLKITFKWLDCFSSLLHIWFSLISNIWSLIMYVKYFYHSHFTLDSEPDNRLWNSSWHWLVGQR